MGGNQNLTADEQLLYERLEPIFEQECLRLVKVLAAKAPAELLGATEFEVRNRVHELGAKALEVAANERQKKGWVRGC
jgi:hypothetical protein